MLHYFPDCWGACLGVAESVEYNIYVCTKTEQFDFLFFLQVFNISGMNVDADQRLTHDVEKLTTDLAGLVTGMVKPLVDILWWVSHGHRYVLPFLNCQGFVCNYTGIYQVHLENEAFIWAKRSCDIVCLHALWPWFSESCISWLWWSCKPRTGTRRHLQVNCQYFIGLLQFSSPYHQKNFRVLTF